MCGICGIFSFKKEDCRETVQKMNNSQSSRGPDDSGLKTFENGITFGHRRLSILDLTDAGHQPMFLRDTSGDIRLAVIHNGEIYNFKEIREELKKEGYEFNTNTDTEVILKGYDKWGIDVIHKFRGMFAFALWDAKKEKLYLVRDRFGIKPLYYYQNNNELLFASTVKALKGSGLIPVKKEKRAWVGFFLFGSVPAPYTTVKNVFSILPGHYLEINKEGNTKDNQYYNLLEYFKNKKNVGFDEAVNETKKLLYESIKYRLISDAPLGVFLSGGIDSSAISAMAAKLRKKPVTTLSIYFDEKDYSEKKYQDLVIKKIKSNHKSIKVTKEDFLKDLDSAFEAMDQPTIDGINTYFIAKSAKETGLKAVLSGLGADEIFAGYENFRKVGFLRKIQKLPKVLKWPLKLTKFLGGRFPKLGLLYHNHPIYLYLALRGLFTPEDVAKILNVSEKEVYKFIESITDRYQLSTTDLNPLHPIDLLSYLELRFYILNQLLKDTDFMSMYHSLEVRVPFLDHKLVEYLAGIPPKLKLQGDYNKLILIKAVEDLIPEEIYQRPKMGFTFPFQKWLQGENKFRGKGWSRTWSNIILEKFK